MDIAKELRGDMFLIANAIKKIQVIHIFVMFHLNLYAFKLEMRKFELGILNLDFRVQQG